MRIQNLLVAVIAMGALAIASAPVSYRCTMKIRPTTVLAISPVSTDKDPLASVYERQTEYSPMTLTEFLSSADMRRKIDNPALRIHMDVVEGEAVNSLTCEGRTPYEAEASVARALQAIRELAPWVIYKTNVRIEPVLPWWRPIAALGLLTLFGVLMPFGRRESL